MEDTPSLSIGARFNNWSTGFFKVATPIAIISAAFTIGQISKEAKLLMFESIEQKEHVLSRISNLPTEIEVNDLKNHINGPGNHLSRNSKDSTYVTRKEFLELIKNNAVDTYNMKRKIDKVLESQEEVAKTLKAMSYKLDRR
jgi:hypothetical protein